MGRNMCRQLIPIVVILHGCGGDQPLQSTAVDRVPVSGRVVVGRQPVAGATVTFEPKFEWNPDLPKPKAVTEADGSFEIGTAMTGDGAPPGGYAVSIVSPQGEGSIRIDSKYARPEVSGFEAVVKNTPSKLPDFVVKRSVAGKTNKD